MDGDGTVAIVLVPSSPVREGRVSAEGLAGSEVAEARTIERRHKTGKGLVGLLIAAFLLQSSYALLRYLTFRTRALDAGLVNNVLWRLSHGYDDVSGLTGVSLFADHLNVGLLSLLPLYAGIPELGLPLLYVLQAGSISLVGWAVWRVAAAIHLRTSVAAYLTLSSVFGPAAFFAGQVDIQPSTLALGPLGMALANAVEGGKRWSLVAWSLIAASLRQEMAVAVLVLGLVLWWSRRRNEGRTIALTGAVVTIGMAAWLLSDPSPGGSLAVHLGHLGSNTTEILATLRSAPWRALGPIGDPSNLVGAFFWLAPFAVVAPLLAWRWLLMAAPLAAIAVLGVWGGADNFYEHYWHGLLLAAPVATAFAVASRPKLSRLVMVGGGVLTVVTWLLMGPLRFPAAAPPPDLTVADEKLVVAFVEAADARSVVVPTRLAPRLSGRPQIDLYPRPVFCSRASLGGYVPPSTMAELVVVDLGLDPLLENQGAAKDVWNQLLRSAYLLRLSTPRYEVLTLAETNRPALVTLTCLDG